MMKQLENTEMLIHGNTALKFLIILVLELLLKEKYSVFMEACLRKLKPSIKSDLLIEEWKFHTKDHFVI